MNGPELIRRSDEQDLREVEIDLEIVVAEGVILRRIEHLEQSRRRVALIARADFVDFVEHEHRVHRAGLLQPLYDAPRDRTDVGAAMTANFGFVAHAAE